MRNKETRECGTHSQSGTLMKSSTGQSKRRCRAAFEPSHGTEVDNK